MEATVYLALALLGLLLKRAGLQSLKGDPRALAVEHVPEEALRAVLREHPGIVVRCVHVEVDSGSSLRYHMGGSLPDGRRLEVIVRSGGVVLPPHGAPGCAGREDTPAERKTALPHALSTLEGKP